MLEFVDTKMPVMKIWAAICVRWITQGGQKPQSCQRFYRNHPSSALVNTDLCRNLGSVGSLPSSLFLAELEQSDRISVTGASRNSKSWAPIRRERDYQSTGWHQVEWRLQALVQV